MRISVKVAPGVRVSGRVGGRRHHRHHHSRRPVRYWAPPTPRGPWLSSPPPWRLNPSGSGCLTVFGWLSLAWLFAELWIVEFEIWLMVWCCIGTARSVKLAIAWNARRRAARPSAPVWPPPLIDPYAGMGVSPPPAQPWPQPEQVRQLPADPWDGQMRRRS